MNRFQSAWPAVLWHLAVSVLVAALAAAVVFGVWYPHPYASMAGGADLFWLVVAVDVVCGPLLTAVIYTPKKSRRELVLDLGLVALIQLSALAYGVHTMAQARPIYLVFEVDRFRVVSVADVLPDTLKPELGGLHVLPWTGPKVIGVRGPRDSEEKMKDLDLSLQGLEPSARPDWWQSYELSKPQVLKMVQPVDVLRKKQADAVALIDQAVAESGRAEASLGWMPLTSFKTTSWVAFVDRNTAEVLAFAPVDGF